MIKQYLGKGKRNMSLGNGRHNEKCYYYLRNSVQGKQFYNFSLGFSI